MNTNGLTKDPGRHYWKSLTNKHGRGYGTHVKNLKHHKSAKVK